MYKTVSKTFANMRELLSHVVAIDGYEVRHYDPVNDRIIIAEGPYHAGVTIENASVYFDSVDHVVVTVDAKKVEE